MSSNKCLENMCNSTFKTNKSLIEHLSREHGMKFEYSEHWFENVDEFQKWKAKIEVENSVSYVYKSKSAFSTYYYCNRSKTSRNPREKGTVYKRSLKTQGSCKMESACTSQIVLHKMEEKYCASWQKTHYGHSGGLENLAHIRLTQNQKININISEITVSPAGSNSPSPVEEMLADLSSQDGMASLVQSSIDLLEEIDLTKLDDSIANELCHHLQIINNLVKLPKLNHNNSLPPTFLGTSKRVIEPQLRFKSIKKNKKVRNNGMNRPLVKDISNIKSFLTTDLFISKNLFNDHKYY